MADFIKWLVVGIVPPRTSDAEMQYRWQSAVALAIYFSLFILAGDITLSYGLTPIYSGFAKASDEEGTKTLLAQIVEGQKRDRIHLIDQQIQSTRTRECGADKDNQDAIGYANEKLTSLRQEYYDLTGNWYPIPRCGVL